MDNRHLIETAAKAIRVHRTRRGYLFGDVGAAILSENGNVFTGVCVDTPSWGICAERAAAAAMVTTGEYIAGKVVAVWKKSQTGDLFVLPPCGHCREFLRNLDDANLDAEIILSPDRSMTLADLMPEHKWPQPITL